MQLLASFTRALNTSDQEAVLLGDLPSRFSEVVGAKRSCGGQVRLTGKMTVPGCYTGLGYTSLGSVRTKAR